MRKVQKIKDSKLTRLKFWSRYVGFTYRFDWLMVLVCLISICIALVYVSKISIRSDFKEMLPDKYRSVIELNKIEKRVKSSGNLIVIVGGDKWPTMRQFINDFVFAAKTALPGDISEIDYNVREVRNFYDQNKYLYIDLPDLKEVHDRLKRQIDYEKIKQSPLYIDLGDSPPKFEISDIQDKYTEKTSSYQHYREGYFTNEEANLAAVLVKPREGSTDVKFAEHLIAKLDEVIKEMDPASYDPSIKIAYGGRYKKIIEQYNSLVGDILKSIFLCVGLVGLVMLVYFKRIRMGFWATIVIAQGTLITLAIARTSIGYLTSQTAFLGSIIVGNGINYGLVILSRYMEERRADRNVKESITIALSTTWLATITSSLTTSGAFAVLAFTKIKGFSQFGYIGGIGMFMCWITTYGFLPSWVSLTERIIPLNVKKVSMKNPYMLIAPIGRWATKHYMGVVKISAVALLLSFILIGWYLPNSLEYDFSKLRFEPPKSDSSWETDARDKVSGIFGQSTTPSVVLADSINDVQPICTAIKERAAKDQMEDIFDECKTIFDFVPADQPAKLDILSDMREILSGSTLSFLKEKQKREVEKFRETFDLKPLALSDIPPEIGTNFEEANGKRGLIAYVYSEPTANLWDGKELIKFANLIREIKLPSGKVVYSSGESVIFADLLQAVVKEGPRVTLFSLLVVIAIVVISFRNTRSSIIITASLLTGSFWLIACLKIFGIKLNFLNFVALPITFGIGVDYAVNIYQRYRLEGLDSMAKVTATTGPAIVLCSSTTVIGYSVLMTSTSRALQSFGLVAVLGEACCLVAALVSMPAFVCYLENRAARKKKN